MTTLAWKWRCSAQETRGCVARGLALFLGAFTLLNIIGEALRQGFDANCWWIDLGAIPQPLALVILTASALLLAAFGLAPAMSPWRRWATVAATAFLLIAAALNSIMFFILVATGRIGAGVPLPLSGLLAIGLAVILASAARRVPIAADGRAVAVSVAIAGVCCALFALAQVFFFGLTDYRRPADAIVVFGARAYADGRPSQALADRMRTACELYRQGHAPMLLLSGGPGDGAIHETEAMRRMAMELGVPERSIITDREGLNTLATVRNAHTILETTGSRSVLAVSHFYHLPRVKLTFDRAGIEAYTVPARQSRVLTKTPIFIAREIAALGVYYLRPIWD